MLSSRPWLLAAQPPSAFALLSACLLLSLPSASRASSSPSLGERNPLFAHPARPLSLAKRSDHAGFDAPILHGGSQLTLAPNTFPEGQGEPLNVILSAESDPRVLVDSPDNGGFRNYVMGLNFSNSCLNAVVTGGQRADLGDGRGLVNQTAELRYNFGDQYFGTCRETINGGNHFRYWRQNSTQAIFMAVSIEMDLARQHDIVVNGYDLGRDGLVGYAVHGDTLTTINTLNVTSNTTFIGSMSYANYTYETSVRYLSDLYDEPNDKVNHFLSVGQNGVNGGNATDRLVAVMTVKITAAPKASSAIAIAAIFPITFLFASASTLVLAWA